MNPTTIDEPISVILISSAETQRAIPYKIKWRERTYKVDDVSSQLHATEKGIDHHVYTLNCGETWFEISLNTNTLQWRLLKINYQ